MIADDMTWKEIKRKVGEMASMENDLRQAQGSREHWKDKCEELEDDMRERYAVLPVDANGATILPGARIRHAWKMWIVRTLMLTDEGEWLLDCRPEDGEPPAGSTIRPRQCAVVEQRTVEDVLYDLLKDLADAGGGMPTDDEQREIISRRADELRSMLDGS